MFYSKSTNGFYSPDIHGARRLVVPDPAWQRPVTDGVPDQAASHPLIEVNNPACLIPADAVQITLEQHAELLAAQSAGKLIAANESGAPVAIEPPLPALSVIKANALAQARAQRQPILSVLDGMQASATHKGETSRASAIELAKQGLKDITKIDLSTCLTPDDFKSTIMLRYRAIAAALPSDVVIAFAEALK